MFRKVGEIMRKSLSDLNPNMIRKVDDYPGLPEELKEYCYWISDSGYSIMAIPERLLKEHFGSMELWLYEIPMPVRYVLEKGWKTFEGYIIVEAGYNSEIGLEMDGDYYDY